MAEGVRGALEKLTQEITYPICDVENSVEQGSAIVSIEGSDISQTETEKEAKITVRVQPCEVRSIKVELRSVFDNSATKTTVVAKGKGVYEVSYRPSVRGRHRLSISLNDDPNVVQFPVFVKHPPTQLKDPIRHVRGFNSPYYCCVSDEQLLVTEYNKGTVASMDWKAGGGTDVKSVVTGLSTTTGIATDMCGFTYVAEIESSRLQVFDKDWKVVRTLDKVGSQPGELNGPWGIAVGADRKVYVCDRGNRRVQVLDENLHHIRSVVPKSGETFKYVLGVACDGTGNLYASDTNTVYKFDKDGQLVSTIGASAAAGLCVQDEFLYIAEYAAKQVSVYTLDGKYVTSFGQDSLSCPWGIAIDADGFVCVSDPGSWSVVVF